MDGQQPARELRVASGHLTDDSSSTLAAHDDGVGPAAALVLAGLLLLEAVLFASFALWPPATTNRVIDSVAAAILLGMAAVSLSVVRWGSDRVVVWLAGLAWLAIVVAVATRKLEASEVLWGGPLILTAVYVAFFLPQRAAYTHLILMLTAFAAASIMFSGQVRPVYLVGVILCAALSALAVGWMRRQRDQALSAWVNLAVTDPLTGLLNRRGLEDEALVVRANVERAGRPIAVAVIDLDGFKGFNDVYGHEAGDGLLQALADHWRATVREGDLVARTGGDEFVIVLPQTDEQTAGHLLDRIRREAVARWSFGVTTWLPSESLARAMDRADGLMYDDKVQRGRARAG